MKLQEPYGARPIGFVEPWQEGNWKLKVCGIAHQRSLPRSPLLEAAKRVARPHLVAANSQEHYGVGCLGVHDGRGANFVFVDYWADEDELHHHVYTSPSHQPEALTYVTPIGS